MRMDCCAADKRVHLVLAAALFSTSCVAIRCVRLLFPIVAVSVSTQCIVSLRLYCLLVTLTVVA